MQILPSTFIALALIGALMAVGLKRGLWLFFAMMPLGAAAAFNMPAVGGASFGIKELAAIALLVMLFARPRGLDSLLGTLKPGQPGGVALLLFVYCVVSAMWVPQIFNGMTEVFTISRSANSNGIRSIPLGPSAGNITQLFALTISMIVFLAMATHSRLSPDTGRIEKALAVATGLNLALGLLDVGSAAAGLPQIMDPLRTANYSILSEARMMGFKRMIGGFPEASSFGSFSMGLFGFWLHRWLADPTSKLARWMLMIALFCVLRSTSSAAYVALAIFVVGYAGFNSATGLRSHVSRQVVMAAIVGALLVWLAAVSIFAAYHLVPGVTAFLDQTVFDKMGSDSGVERMSWNTQAFRNFTDTWLIGAGLGSARASNWLLSSLGSIGLPGTLLFVWFLFGVFRMKARPSGGPEDITVTALKWGCASTLSTELLIASTPNLGVFFFALAGLATGLARSTQSAVAARGVPQGRFA